MGHISNSRKRFNLVLFLGMAFLLIGSARMGFAELRVYPEGELPKDRRLEPLKNLNGYFPFAVPETKADWEARAKELRRRVLVATGLWPMPEKTPLNPEIYGKTKRDGFTVEKVYFESLPGHYVTGLLFRPESGGDQRHPGILCPHGHGGRLQDYGEKAMPKLIEQGAERFEKSGRYPKLGPLCPVGPDGVRGIYLRHGRLCRQSAAFLSTHPSLRQTTAGRRFQDLLGIL